MINESLLSYLDRQAGLTGEAANNPENQANTVSSRNVSIPKRNHINVAIVDWGTFVYEFSCDKQEWELKESTFGGV